MKAPSGYILIRGNRYDETFKTEGGLELYRYLQEGNETFDVNYWGEVIAVPVGGKGNIIPIVAEGDKAYIHYNTFLDPFNYIPQLDAWRVAYEDVLCVVRGERIVPVGGWCLVSPVEEKIDSGKFLTKIEMEDGTILGADYTIRPETRGILAHIGISNMGEDLNPAPKPGDMIAFSREDAFENKVEGKTYFCMKQNRIVGIYENSI